MIQPDEFLCSAEGCYAQNDITPHEAHLRSTISRAYYAAFHHAKAEAVKHGIRVDPPSEHNKLIDALLKTTNQQLVTAGNRLSMLRNKRTVSDYHLQKTVQKSEARGALKAARILIEQFP